MLYCSDLGPKFDLELLRSKPKVHLKRDKFERCCLAAKSAIDFVVRDCWCQSSDVIGGDARLISFVYYLLYRKRLEIPNSQIEHVRKSFYPLGFTRPFARNGDS